MRTLEEIEADIAAATPAERWRQVDHELVIAHDTGKTIGQPDGHTQWSWLRRKEDVRFIVNARKDVPELVAEVRTGRDEREAMRKELETLRAELHEAKAWHGAQKGALAADERLVEELRATIAKQKAALDKIANLSTHKPIGTAIAIATAAGGTWGAKPEGAWWRDHVNAHTVSVASFIDHVRHARLAGHVDAALDKLDAGERAFLERALTAATQLEQERVGEPSEVEVLKKAVRELLDTVEPTTGQPLRNDLALSDNEELLANLRAVVLLVDKSGKSEALAADYAAKFGSVTEFGARPDMTGNPFVAQPKAFSIGYEVTVDDKGVQHYAGRHHVPAFGIVVDPIGTAKPIANVFVGPGWMTIGVARGAIQRGERLALEPSTGDVDTLARITTEQAVEQAARIGEPGARVAGWIREATADASKGLKHEDRWARCLHGMADEVAWVADDFRRIVRALLADIDATGAQPNEKLGEYAARLLKVCGVAVASTEAHDRMVGVIIHAWMHGRAEGIKQGAGVRDPSRPNLAELLARRDMELLKAKHTCILVDGSPATCEACVMTNSIQQALPPESKPTIEQLCDDHGIESADIDALKRERDQLAALIGMSSEEVASKLRRGELPETENVRRWIDLDAFITAAERA